MDKDTLPWLPVPTIPENGSTWKHQKGGVYSVVYTVRDSEDPNRFLVIYRNIEHGSFWAREHGNFLGNHSNGMPRFEKL